MMCPKCSGETYTEQRGQHIGLFCRKCGYIKFLPQHWQGFIMPIGKYKGKNLQEIKSSDIEYLKWASKNISGSIARRITEALSDNMESIKTIIPRCL